jgi:thiol-disulfide isomerase/thioredoxin
VNKYKDAAFVTGDLKPLKVWSDQKLYKLPDATLMWVFTNGYTVVETPEKVGIRIVSQGGKEITRTFELPSGRTCSVENRERVVWGLAQESAPDFTLSVLDAAARTIRLADFRGRVVLLDFWASWCQPCMKRLPDTEALYQKLKGRGLEVFGINIEGDTSRAEGAVKSLGLTFPVLMGEPDEHGRFNWTSRQITDYRINAIPTMFLIDKQGVIQKAGDVKEEDVEKCLSQ